MSDRGWTCQYELTVNQSEWNVNKSSILIYFHSVQNMTVYLGFAESRDKVFVVNTIKNITTTTKYFTLASLNAFIAAVPDLTKLDSELIFSFSL